MCVFLISPVPIAEPLTSEFIDIPVFHNLAPVFCRFVLPCQIFLPPIKTVGSTIRQRKILPVKLYFINLCTYHNPKLSLTVMHIQ